MSVSQVSRVFTGGLWDRRALAATQIRPDVAQGPVPAYLREEMEDEEEPRYVTKRKPSPNYGQSPERLREKAKLGREARAQKQRVYANPFPCPVCAGPTWNKGTAAKPRRWCQACRVSYHIDPETKALVSIPSRAAKTEPCPHCPGVTVSKDRKYRRCRSCGAFVRRVPKAPPPPPCSACGGKTRRDGRIRHRKTREPGKQALRCVECGKSVYVEPSNLERKAQ